MFFVVNISVVHRIFLLCATAHVTKYQEQEVFHLVAQGFLYDLPSFEHLEVRLVFEPIIWRFIYTWRTNASVPP